MDGQNKTAGVTNANGAVTLGVLPTGMNFQVQVPSMDTDASFVAIENKVYEIRCRPKATVDFVVWDADGIAIDGATIRFSADGSAREHTLNTAAGGKSSATGGWQGETLRVLCTYGGVTSKPVEKTITDTYTEIELVLDIKRQVFLLDTMGKPMETQLVTLVKNDAQVEMTTLIGGEVPAGGLLPGDIISVRTQYKGRRYNSNEVTIQLDAYRYEVRLKRNWWWLLWGLLPLLLLLIPLPYKPGIVVTDARDSQPIANAATHWVYPAAADDVREAKGHTDSLGRDAAHLGWQTLFAKLFLKRPSGTVSLQKTCYRDTTISLQEVPRWWRLRVAMSPTIAEVLPFVVRDSLTQRPIAGAQVQAKVAYHGRTLTDTVGITGDDGTFTLHGVPLCAGITVSAEKPKHTADTIGWVMAADLMPQSQDRNLYLAQRQDCQPQSDGRRQQRERAVVQLYDLGVSAGTFTFEYNTYSQSDRIEIFCKEQLIWSYEGRTQTSLFDDGFEEVRIAFDAPHIRVVVTGTTAWDYTVFCPD